MQNSDKSPFFIAVEANNVGFALKLLEYQNGIANLEGGKLTQIPDIVLEWCRKGILKELNLNDNELNNLPVDLRFLKTCTFENNPLISLPSDLRSAKWPKVKKYLESTTDKANNWNTRKLVLLGPRESGKTSLYCFLPLLSPLSLPSFPLSFLLHFILPLSSFLSLPVFLSSLSFLLLIPLPLPFFLPPFLLPPSFPPFIIPPYPAILPVMLSFLPSFHSLLLSLCLSLSTSPLIHMPLPFHSSSFLPSFLPTPCFIVCVSYLKIWAYFHLIFSSFYFPCFLFPLPSFLFHLQW